MSKQVVALLGLALLASVVSVSASSTTAPAELPEEPAVAPAPGTARTGVVIGKADRRLTVWTKKGQEVFTYTADTLMPIRKMKDGNLVWVRTTGPNSNVAAQIIIVDEQISVVGRLGREHAVIGTTWQAQSPSHVAVRSKDGKEMFVLDPKTFRQPLPKPGERVAVTYRIENIKPPRYIATGIRVLPAELDQSPVKITYSDVPREEVVAEAPRPVPPAPAPVAVIAELPQTASATPLFAVIGALLLAAGLAVRSFAR